MPMGFTSHTFLTQVPPKRNHDSGQWWTTSMHPHVCRHVWATPACKSRSCPPAGSRPGPRGPGTASSPPGSWPGCPGCCSQTRVYRDRGTHRGTQGSNIEGFRRHRIKFPTGAISCLQSSSEMTPPPPPAHYTYRVLKNPTSYFSETYYYLHLFSFL